MTSVELVPMRSLAARLDYDASNLSVLIDRLERRGAVERRPDPADRRVKAPARRHAQLTLSREAGSRALR
jgi:DNA-binding MarR family transcriptional regulator